MDAGRGRRIAGALVVLGVVLLLSGTQVINTAVFSDDQMPEEPQYQLPEEPQYQLMAIGGSGYPSEPIGSTDHPLIVDTFRDWRRPEFGLKGPSDGIKEEVIRLLPPEFQFLDEATLTCWFGNEFYFQLGTSPDALRQFVVSLIGEVEGHEYVVTRIGVVYELIAR